MHFQKPSCSHRQLIQIYNSPPRHPHPCRSPMGLSGQCHAAYLQFVIAYICLN
uniref:Uncharacterized protein n=1 Tax=Anguilla anguilla TaxID=7936 RepID=A0A0E9TZD1_ANGAN